MSDMHKTSIRMMTILLLYCWAPLGTAQQTGAGIHANQSVTVIQKQLTAGSLSFRMEIPWKVVEVEKGVLAFPSAYAKFDALAKDAVNRGTPALLLLDYGNQFYGGGDNGGEEPVSAAAMQGFANYAGFMVTHFKGVITQFEVYNEWNSNITSTAVPRVGGDAGAYVNLLKVTYAAIKAANPNALVVGGVVGGTDTNWITHFIAAGGLNYLDVFSVHPYVYRHATKPDAPSGVTLSWIPAAGAATTSTPIPGTPEESIAWLDQIKAKVDQASPNRSVPMIVSELGWPTSSMQSGVLENAAAAYDQRFILMAHTRPWITGVWWYELLDGGPDATQAENRFGLLRQDGTPKPAFTALVQLNNFIFSKSPAIQKTISNEAIAVSGLQTDNTEFYAAWLPINDFKQTHASDEVKSLLSAGYQIKSATAAPVVGAVPILLEH